MPRALRTAQRRLDGVGIERCSRAARRDGFWSSLRSLTIRAGPGSARVRAPRAGTDVATLACAPLGSAARIAAPARRPAAAARGRTGERRFCCAVRLPLGGRLGRTFGGRPCGSLPRSPPMLVAPAPWHLNRRLAGFWGCAGSGTFDAGGDFCGAGCPDCVLRSACLPVSQTLRADAPPPVRYRPAVDWFPSPQRIHFYEMHDWRCRQAPPIGDPMFADSIALAHK